MQFIIIRIKGRVNNVEKINKNIFFIIGFIIILAVVFICGRLTADNSKQVADLERQIIELNKQYQDGIDKLSKGIGEIKASTNGIKSAVDNSTRAIQSSIVISGQIESADNSAGSHIKTAIGILDELTKQIDGTK